jgi:hypothetical protein
MWVYGSQLQVSVKKYPCLLPIAPDCLPIAPILLPDATDLLPFALILLPFAPCLLPFALFLLPIAPGLLPVVPDWASFAIGLSGWKWIFALFECDYLPHIRKNLNLAGTIYICRSELHSRPHKNQKRRIW